MIPRADRASSRRMLQADRTRRGNPVPVQPDNRFPATMRMPLSAGGCWCMLPASHDWPGKEDGAPHPRRAMWSGLARQPWEQGDCLNEHCGRLSEPGVWFCCGLCAEASDFHHAAVVHADPCNQRNPDRRPGVKRLTKKVTARPDM